MRHERAIITSILVMTPAADEAAAMLFAGPGEMRALCRAFNWTDSPLGPVAGWSPHLRTTVDIVLGSAQPMFLWWGPQLIQLYNDAYRPCLGTRSLHPSALGARGREFWPEIWDVIGPQIDQVMTGGNAMLLEDQHLPMDRRGRLDDAWFTFSFNPVRDSDGSVGGTLVVCLESTHRIIAERERADHRAARILDQVADEHLTMDGEFRILSVNAAAERALGKPRDAFVGRTHWEAFPASVGSEVERQYRRVVAERTEAHFTHHYVGEGYDVHLEIDAYPTDDGGAAIFWRDVTSRVVSERALRESEEKYRTLFDSIDVGFCVIEVLFDADDRPADYRYLETNPAFVQQSGIADAVGRTVRDLIPAIEEHWFETYGRVARTGESTRFQNKSETMGRWFDLFAFRIGEPAQRRVAVFFTDVSAAHALEREREQLVRALKVERARLEEVFRRAPSFIAVLRGPDNVFEVVNEAYRQLVGHRKILGLPFLEAVPEMRNQGFSELLDHVRTSGEPWVGSETSALIQRIAGAPLETRYIDFVMLPFTEADGTRSGVVAHGSDVTEQVLARRDVERLLAETERVLAETEGARADAEAARAEAEAANRAKGEFLAVMSHELRTPLNAIGGYAELIEMGIRGAVTDLQREDLRRIQASQRHLLRLINDVLSYAKLESGEEHYSIEAVSMHDAVSAAETLVAPQVRSKDLVLTLGDIAPGLTVLADAEKLRQIIVNLLSNAVKFTGRGGRIDVACVVVGTRVMVRVSDTGIGIPAEKLEMIFAPFMQVQGDLKRAYEGTGLGLAIGRDLARGMAGDITVESVPGTGSVFTLELPLA